MDRLQSRPSPDPVARWGAVISLLLALVGLIAFVMSPMLSGRDAARDSAIFIQRFNDDVFPLIRENAADIHKLQMEDLKIRSERDNVLSDIRADLRVIKQKLGIKPYEAFTE
jgi:hypothetical protein